jgi:hypothetical protein
MVKQAIVASLAGALVIGAAGNSFAGALPTGTVAMKAAAATNTIDVRWRGYGWGWRRNWVPGLALGLFGAALGAAVAGPYAYYGPRYYDYGYGPAYAYYGPPYPYYGAYAYYPPVVRPYYRPFRRWGWGWRGWHRGWHRW